MRVLIACDKFKGSMSAGEACRAVARGLGAAWSVDLCPISDGGEGFVDALAVGSGSRRVSVAAGDALGRPVEAPIGLLGDPSAPTAVIEMSAASGLWRIRAAERDIRRATTVGTGEMMRRAVEDFGASRLLVGIGGSATNDGGAGMAHALGVRFLDGHGAPLDPWPAALARLESIDESARIELPEVVVACDVDNPLLGERGASVVFGPQKGADPEDVLFLDDVLERLVAASDGEHWAARPGAGAAGGLGFGLMRFAGARLVSGFELVADALDLAARISRVDLVVTGEGSLDAQTLGGKGPGGVAGLAARAGVPVVAVCGRSDAAARDSGLFRELLDLGVYELSVEESMRRGAELLTRRVSEAAGLLGALVSG
jgi:glycerate kinase